MGISLVLLQRLVSWNPDNSSVLAAVTVESQESEMKELKEKANGGLQRWKIALVNLSREIQVSE